MFFSKNIVNKIAKPTQMQEVCQTAGYTELQKNVKNLLKEGISQLDNFNKTELPAVIEKQNQLTGSMEKLAQAARNAINL